MQSITLSELAFQIKDALGSHLAPSYWVTAEIGDMKVNARGHCYMELVEKEGDQVKAKLRAAIWAYDFRNINQWFERVTGGSLREGIKILANAQVTFHEVYGLNLTIKDVDPNFTLGDRERRKQEIIAHLVAEGLMERNRSLALPVVPQRIAVVSSSTAAGYGDFIHHLYNNRQRFAITTHLFQAVLQGKEAPTSIALAIGEAGRRSEEFDMIAVIRGGGANMDLDAFNEYSVCEAIARSPLPVLTGIGHERDETVADMVAHTRLKTPTAVASFILEGFESFADTLQTLAARMQQKVAGAMAQQQHLLVQLSKDLRHSVKSQVSNEKRRIDESITSLFNACRWKLERDKMRLREHQLSVFSGFGDYISTRNNELDKMKATVEASDPARILERGYSYSTVKGKMLHKVKVNVGDKLTTHYSKGVIESEVSAIKEHDK